MSHPYQLRSMDTRVEQTEGHSGGAEAARSHVPLELAGRDSELETNSSFNDENRTAVVASHSTQLQQLQQTTVAPVSSPAASHGVAGDQTCPSLAPQRSGIADQSGRGYSTLYPAYIDANAMTASVSVVATPTDLVIDRQSTTQSGHRQTYTPTVVYDTVAMGTGPQHATPPVQSDTAAYTQVGPMAPGHSCSSINTQLAPRHSGRITQSIHEQLGSAPVEPEYTSQPSVASQPSLSMNETDYVCA